MILMDHTKETVTFDFEGKTFQMTPEEIEAAYRYQERQYRKCDAEIAIQYFAFGEDNPEGMSDDEFDQRTAEFEREYGVKYEDLVKNAAEIVGIFFCKHDCNVAENTTWELTIEDMILRMKLPADKR